MMSEATRANNDAHQQQSNSNNNNSNNNDGDDSNKKEKKRHRMQAEFDLVFEFVSIFGKHHKRIVQQQRQAKDMEKLVQPQQTQQAEDVVSAPTSSSSSTRTRTTVMSRSATNNDDNVPELTETEQRVLSRTYYQNWNAGVLAGATTFGLLMGFSHFSARRAMARRGLLPPPPKKSYTQGIDHPVSSSRNKSYNNNNINNSAQFQQMEAKKSAHQQQQQQQSWAVDPSRVLASSLSSYWNNFRKPTATTATTTSSSKSHNNNNMAAAAAAVSDDALPDGIMTQIQMMIYGGMALVVTIITSWATIDKKEQYQELAKLPLAPGRSYLCHAACPEVVEKYYSYNYNNPSTRTAATAAATAAAAVGESKIPDVAAGELQETQVTTTLDAATILNDPMTEVGEAMARLVVNCQQRMQYEKDHGQGSDIVDVPEPGVPSNYTGISVQVALE
jgi:hypothetical protein